MDEKIVVKDGKEEIVEPVGLNYIFSGDIDIENVTDLISAIDRGAREIYFASDGGIVSLIDIMLNVFEKNNITLYAYDRIVSAGFHTFARYSGPKVVLPGCTAGIHMFNTSIDWIDTNASDLHPGYYSNVSLLQASTMLNDKDVLIEEFRNYGIPDECIKRISLGEDVFIDYPTLTKLNLWGVTNEYWKDQSI